MNHDILATDLDVKEAAVLLWAGLPRTVALPLVLILNHSSNIPPLAQEARFLFVFFTDGAVFLTLIVHGSTTQILLHLLSIDTTELQQNCKDQH